MVSLFIIVCSTCFLYAHSFCQKPQKFSMLSPVRNVYTKYPKLPSHRNCEQPVLCTMQTIGKLSDPTKESISYWDVYGRVPYDDWLFTTSRLTNPDLLKRSFVETVNQEIPIAIANFRRRMGIRSVFGSMTMIVPICLLLLYISQRWHYSSNPLSRQFAREEAVRGFKTAIGALRKATGSDSTKKKTSGGDGRGRRGPPGDEDRNGEVPYADLDGDRILDSF